MSIYRVSIAVYECVLMSLSLAKSRAFTLLSPAF